MEPNKKEGKKVEGKSRENHTHYNDNSLNNVELPTFRLETRKQVSDYVTESKSVEVKAYNMPELLYLLDKAQRICDGKIWMDFIDGEFKIMRFHEDGE